MSSDNHALCLKRRFKEKKHCVTGWCLPVCVFQELLGNYPKHDHLRVVVSRRERGCAQNCSLNLSCRCRCRCKCKYKYKWTTISRDPSLASKRASFQRPELDGDCRGLRYAEKSTSSFLNIPPPSFCIPSNATRSSATNCHWSHLWPFCLSTCACLYSLLLSVLHYSEPPIHLPSQFSTAKRIVVYTDLA